MKSHLLMAAIVWVAAFSVNADAGAPDSPRPRQAQRDRTLNSTAQIRQYIANQTRAGVLREVDSTPYRQMALAVFSRLEQMGLREFSGINLEMLARGFSQTRVLLNSGNPLAGFEGRVGALAFAGLNVVILNTRFLELFSNELLHALYFHEFFLANGFRDDDYVISTAMLAVAAGHGTKILEANIQAWLRTFASSIRSTPKAEDLILASPRGGATGVGGGGDPQELEIKFILLLAILSQGESLRIESMREFSRLRIQVLYEDGPPSFPSSTSYIRTDGAVGTRIDIHFRSWFQTADETKRGLIAYLMNYVNIR